MAELLGPVAERVDRSLTLERLKHALAQQPAVFRLLDPWRGPWRPVGVDAGTGPGEVWVVLVRDPAGPPQAAGARPGTVEVLRESVRWLARAVDDRSTLSVSRWYAMAISERESRKALARRAA
jgi:hypothetical protein